MPAYDLLIHGGTVIDPAAGLHAVRDVAIAGGKVAAVDDDLPRDQAARTMDARGKLVLPGLIDIHAHIFKGVFLGADPETACLARGTTTVLDPGSTGAGSFAGFKEHIIERNRIHVLAWLNVSLLGVLQDMGAGELTNLNALDIDAAVQTVEANRDLIVGLKARLSPDVTGGQGLPALRLARRAADAAGVPLMVHVVDTWEPLPQILALLRPRDVMTHSLSGRRHGILDYHGILWPSVREAREAGVFFDIGHGRGAFGFDVARRALEQGFLPDTISTDLTKWTAADPTFHLPAIMSKLMAIGVSLDEVVAMVTRNPSHVLGRDGEIGTLRLGGPGDATVLEVLEGDFVLGDNEGQQLAAKQRLRPWKTVLGGEVVDAAPEFEARPPLVYQIGSRQG